MLESSVVEEIPEKLDFSADFYLQFDDGRLFMKHI